MSDATAISKKSGKTRSQAASAVVSALPEVIDQLIWGGRNNPAFVGKLKCLVDELGLHYPRVARSLERHAMNPVPLASVPHDLITFMEPRFAVEEVSLPPDVIAVVAGLKEEHLRIEALQAVGLHPRNRIAILGPPGNGKSMLAEAMARELDVPFLRVRYSGLVDSHLGVTARNIDKLIEYAQRAPCLLFWDEFDGVAIARNAGSDVTEMRRVTNQLLLALDALAPHTILVAASNETTLIDKAILRRFDVRINLPTPSRATAMHCATHDLRRADALFERYDIDRSCIAQRVVDLELDSLSALVALCQRIRRDLVLNLGENIERLLEMPSG